MILAFIAMFAALNTRSAYKFVDVSNIDVTGDQTASVGETVRGEHIARFYEWLAESRWMMDACGADIPRTLASWTPPTPNKSMDAASINSAIDAYKSAIFSNTNSNSRVCFAVNRSWPSYPELCYSSNDSGTRSSDTITQIVDSSWRTFWNNHPFGITSVFELPSITNGAPIRCDDINTLNIRSTSNLYLYPWTDVGCKRSWNLIDNSYAETVTSGDRWAEGAPFEYPAFPSYGSSSNPSYLEIEMEALGGGYKIPRIVKAEGGIPPTTISTTFHESSSKEIRNKDGEIIRGRDGIPLYNIDICVFVCVWKCGWTSWDEAKINVRVYAQSYRLWTTDKIGDMIDNAWNQTDYPSGLNHVGYAAILFVGAGMANFSPNAYH